MFGKALPFVPPATLFISSCFLDFLYRSIVIRLAIYTTITAVACLAIISPPFNNALLNYLTGFFSFWYIIWSANILFIYRPLQLRRLKRHGSPAEIAYRWEGLPPPYTHRRFQWAWDLSTNYRGIGWEHTMPTDGYPPLKTHGVVKDKDFSPRIPLICRQVRRIVVSYILLDLAQNVLHMSWRNSLDWARAIAEIIATGLALFGFTDGLHALATLIGVGLLGGEEWMYPALFGRLEYFKQMRIKDIWGRVWHDLFRSGFLSLSQAIAPKGPAVLLVCFILSGLLHAAASYSASRDTTATMWVFFFFCAQPMGVILQAYIDASVKGIAGEPKSSPIVPMVRRFLVFLAGVVFVYHTFPWACRDPGLREAINGAPLPWSLARLLLASF
ncbi:hypothetical protein MGYG_04929 [Nannizzia gypsea CBS 118893]|uniref:Wax synthase domain-containing protein n=1 Tax=Arthroderma gypseum (strain ATCC MYA-4604 / CBS 118893) TaxID=535722 RepID=E4UXN4_ARTGP|nr:hypothetical protein MGYG_04929 [Nannizzia gypsea CBS 118893]EFR01929.1 hypothetical protein MGYG_04929 [Nannizzia gypsea CBS 118893]